MPATSIDTFFACTVLVSVALIATAFLAGTMQTQINSMQDLNKQDYLRAIADRMVLGCGEPVDWGSSDQAPSTFGLATSSTSGFFVLDADKVSRLTSQNTYALSYPELLGSAHIDNIAVGISVSPIFSVAITLESTVTVDQDIIYNFTVSTSQDAGPLNASLSCYLAADSVLLYNSSATSASGVGSVEFTVPESAAGAAALVVFARSSLDDRMTSVNVYSFGFGDEDSVNLSVFNGTLTAEPLAAEAAVTNVYALTYSYQTPLTATDDSSFVVPSFVDSSPIVLLVQGVNSGSIFLQWTMYPQVPFTAGADLSQSTTNVFTYPVTINGTLYKLTISFGDVFK